MNMRVTIGTSGPQEGSRVRSCLCVAVPRIGEHLELDSGEEWGRYTVTEVRHRPKSVDPRNSLNPGEDEPSIYVAAVAWDTE